MSKRAADQGSNQMHNEIKKPRMTIGTRKQARKDRHRELQACISSLENSPPLPESIVGEAKSIHNDVLCEAKRLQLDEKVRNLEAQWRAIEDYDDDQTKFERLRDLTEIGTALVGHKFQDDLFPVLLSRVTSEESEELITTVLRNLALFGKTDELRSFFKGKHCTETHMRHVDNANGRTLLHYAASRGRVETLEYLLSEHFGPEDLQVKDKFKPYCTPVECCIWDDVFDSEDGDVSCVQFLVDRCNDFDSNSKSLRKAVKDLRGFEDGIPTASLIEKAFRHYIELPKEAAMGDSQERLAELAVDYTLKPDDVDLDTYVRQHPGWYNGVAVILKNVPESALQRVHM